MLHKMVNGKQVFLSEEEEKNVLEEWEKNRLDKETELKRNLHIEEWKYFLKKQICAKLEISQEDFDLIFFNLRK